MVDKPRNIENLILLYLQNEINAEQKAALDTWVAQSAENRKLFEDLTNHQILRKKLIDFFNIDSTTTSPNTAGKLLNKIR
jgi:hypothetical protein